MEEKKEGEKKREGSTKLKEEKGREVELRVVSRKTLIHQSKKENRKNTQGHYWNKDFQLHCISAQNQTCKRNHEQNPKRSQEENFITQKCFEVQITKLGEITNAKT